MRPIADYLLPRIKLAFGRTMAMLTSLALLRRDETLPLVRIGTEYGGWYCCRTLLGPGRTAMCCGAGEDISFDVALNARWSMRIICVDPTPRSVVHVQALLAASREGRPMSIEAGPAVYDLTGFRPEHFTFCARAVWSSDGTVALFAPRNPVNVSYSAVNLQRTSDTIRVRSNTVHSLLTEFGVERISLLKLDIEGAEYEVLRSMVADGVRPEQLLVEFDQVNQPLTPWFWVELLRIIRELRRAGYRLVFRERSNYLFVLSAALQQ
jgi:FkbM family methyltransferase